MIDVQQISEGLHDTDKEGARGQVWYFMLVIPAFGRERQEDLLVFETRLSYTVRSRPS